MKKIAFLMGLWAASICTLFAQVPLATEDVMLQAFYWNSHGETKWSQLNSQASEIGETFDLVWLPPASAAEGGGGMNMGYHPWKWSSLSSSWGGLSELMTLIKSLHAKDCKVIADIVINHRAGNSAGGDFPEDDFNKFGKHKIPNYCITKDDENSNGSCSDYDYKWNVQGDMWGGYSAARDLAHSKNEVRTAVKAYLNWLKELIGFDGFRYDLVKGYDPKYTKEYNTATKPYFSVGEFYQSNYDDLAGWVNGTGKTSLVFDFCFKQAIYDWGGGGNYGKLAWMDGQTKRPAGLIHNAGMRQYAVTFIDNHDTATPHEWPWEYKGNIEQANAIMLSAAGVPCVFWKHWKSNKAAIKKMIAARKAMGVHSNSDVKVTNTNGYYESKAVGTKGTLICRVGSWSGKPDGYSEACSGSGWAYYTSTKIDPNPGDDSGNTGGNTGGDDSGNTGGTTSYSYAIRVNGKTNYEATYMGKAAHSDHEEYKVSVKLNAGDTFETYDLVNNAAWVMKIEEGGESANFTAGAKSVTCNKTGCYDFYIKMMYQNDIMYIGAGTNCSGGGSDSGDDSGNTGGNTGGDDSGNTGGLPSEYRYSIRVNGTTDYEATFMGKSAHSDHDEFMVSVQLKQGDTFVTYDLNNEAGWVMAIESYGAYANFTAGTDKVTCNTAGCYNFYIKMMYENDSMYIGEGTNCSNNGKPTDIEEGTSTEVSIYPNPADGNAIILSNQEVNYVTIRTLSGMPVATATSNELDLNGLAPSMYLVEILFENGEKAVQKLIKK